MGDGGGGRVYSPVELARFDGESSPEIYISFRGTVYDVSGRRDMYGRTPKPGPYHLFAGRECCRSLCTMSMDPADVGSVDLDDLAGITAKVGHVLSPKEIREAVDKALRDWQQKFAENYPVVGRLVGDGQDVGAALPPVSLTGLRSSGLQGLQGLQGSAEAAAAELGPGPVEVVSRKPRIYVQRRFLSQAECRRIISMTLRQQEGSRFQKKVRAPLMVDDERWDTQERAFIQDVEDRIAALAGLDAHEDEAALVGTLTPPGCEEAISGHLGLHVDTNQRYWRYCTAIVYLSSVPSGGETVFPAAVCGAMPSEEEERAVEAAGRLLDLGVDHTDKALQQGQSPEAAAAAQELLRASSSPGCGARVAPEEGTVCVFWTRWDDGEIDPHSWHGGAPVPAGDAWKWTLQKFKEVPAFVRNDFKDTAVWVRENRLQALRREAQAF